MTIWQESVPSNDSFVGNAPVDFKRVWSTVAAGMAVEHFFEGSGGASTASSGDLRLGASRAFVGERSACSVPSQGTGRVFLDRTNSRLYVFDSAGTYVGGTSWLEEMATSSNGSLWARSAGNVASVPTTSGTTIVAFPFTFAQTPLVNMTSSSISWSFSLVSSTATNFTSCFTSWAGAAGTATLYWEALGQLSGASV